MEALRDEHIVKLIKVDTTENLVDLNSKLPSAMRFEYLVNKIMVRNELPTPKAAASTGEALVHAHALRAHALAQPGEGYAFKAYLIAYTAA